MTQQKLSFLLALYIGLFMNCAVFYRRFVVMRKNLPFGKAFPRLSNLATVLVTFFCFVFFHCLADVQRVLLTAGGAVFRWRQLLHDLPERGDWLRHYCVCYDHRIDLSKVVGLPLRIVADCREACFAHLYLGNHTVSLHVVAPATCRGSVFRSAAVMVFTRRRNGV